MANYIFNINGNGCTNQKIGQYDKDNCDVTSISIAAKTEGESLWDGVSITANTNGEITLTVPANPSTTNGRTQEVTISYTIGETEGSIDATLCQKNNGSGPPSVCCSSYSFGEIINIIPDTGVTTTPLAVINLTSTSEECDFSNVTVTSSTITELSVDSSNGTVYVNKCSAVGQEDVKNHVITLVSNGATCSSVSHEIPQDGDTSRCDCTSINSWVVPLKRTFSNSVHTNQLIASAYTHYCGVVSAVTQSDMLYGGNVTCDYTHGERQTVAYIYASIEPNTSGEQRSCGIKLFFKKAGSSEFGECVDKNITLIQGNNYASCSRITYPEEPNKTVGYDSRYCYWYFTVPEGTRGYYALKAEVISGDFITSIEDEASSSRPNQRAVRAYYGNNSSENSRTALIRCTPYCDVSWISGSKWVGGIACDPIDLKLTQTAGAGSPCECSNANLELKEPTIVITENIRHYRYSNIYYTCNGTRGRLPSGWRIVVKSYEPQSLIYEIEGPSWSTDHYYFTVRIEGNPEGVAREGSIVYALETPDGECKTVTQVVKNDAITCTDCQTTLNGLQLYGFMMPFKAAGYTNDNITTNNGACFKGLIATQCDSQGNAATYDWFTINSISKPATTYVSVLPNETSSSRTGYIKYVPTDANDNPIFDDCYKIQTLTQNAFTIPSCNGLASEEHGSISVTAYTSGNNKITAGTENSDIAKLRVSSEVYDIRNIELSLSTTQGVYLSNIQYTKGERQYDYNTRGGDNTSYIEFNITCNTHDDGSMPDVGIVPTIDYAIITDGSTCDNAKLKGIISVNLAKPQ